MDRSDEALFIAFIVVYVPTWSLYHFMIFRVNKELPLYRKIRHSLFYGGWTKLRDEYKGFYPRSSLYHLTVSGAISCLVIATVIFVFNFWKLLVGR